MKIGGPTIPEKKITDRGINMSTQKSGGVRGYKGKPPGFRVVRHKPTPEKHRQGMVVTSGIG